jgi:hypothetical protein
MVAVIPALFSTAVGQDAIDMGELRMKWERKLDSI